MIIAQLVTRRQFRGAEVSACRLSEGLARNNHKVFFVGLYPPPDQVLLAEGAINIDLDGQRKGILSPALLHSVMRFINDACPDVIQANGSDTLKYAIIARVFTRVKPVIVYRNISVMSTWVGRNFARKLFNRYLLRQTDFITSVGDESMADIVANFGVPKNKITVVRRGISFVPHSRVEARARLCAEFGIVAGSPVLIHVGHFSKEKNHDFLLDAFIMIKNHFPQASLLLVGDGQLRSEKMRRVMQKGISNVFFPGLRKDAPYLLAASDLLLLTSTVEGVPGVVLEAAAQETPTVAVNVGGIPEVIRDGETGVLVARHETRIFSDAVCHLLDHASIRTEMGKRAHDFVGLNYSPDAAVTHVSQIYQRLVQAKSSYIY